MYLLDPPWTEEYRPGPGWRLLGADYETRKTEWFLDEGDKVKIRTVAPVDDLFDINSAIRAEKAGKNWGDGIEHVASIPPHLWQRQLAEPIQQEDEKAIKKWLNDSDNAKFRTREGKV